MRRTIFFVVVFLCALFSQAVAMEISDNSAVTFPRIVPRLTDIAAKAYVQKRMVDEYKSFGIDEMTTDNLTDDIGQKINSMQNTMRVGNIIEVPVEVNDILARHTFNAFFEREDIEDEKKRRRKKRWKYNLKVENNEERGVKKIFFEDGMLCLVKKGHELLLKSNDSEKTIVCDNYAISKDGKQAIVIFNSPIVNGYYAKKPTVRLINTVKECEMDSELELPGIHPGLKISVQAFDSNYIQYSFGNDSNDACKLFYAFDKSLLCMATKVKNSQWKRLLMPKDCLHCYDFKVLSDGKAVCALVDSYDSSEKKIQLQRYIPSLEGSEIIREIVCPELLFVPDGTERITLNDVTDDAILYSVHIPSGNGSLREKKVFQLSDKKIFVQNNTHPIPLDNSMTSCMDFKIHSMIPSCIVAVRSQDDYPLAKIFSLHDTLWNEVKEFKFPFTNQNDRVELYRYNDNWIHYGIPYEQQFPSSPKYLKVLLTPDELLCIKTKAVVRTDNFVVPLPTTEIIECDDFIVSEDENSIAMIQYPVNYDPDDKTYVEVIKKCIEEIDGQKKVTWRKVSQLSFPLLSAIKLQSLNSTHLLCSIRERPLADDDGGCLGGKKLSRNFGNRFRVFSLDSHTLVYDKYHSYGEQPLLPTFGNNARLTNVTLEEILGNVAYTNIKKNIAEQNQKFSSMREEQIRKQLVTCSSLLKSHETKHKVMQTQERLQKIYRRASFFTKIRMWARRWRNFLKPVIYLGNWSTWSNALLGLHSFNSKKMTCLKVGLGFAISFPVSSCLNDFLMCGSWQKDDQKWWNKQK